MLVPNLLKSSDLPARDVELYWELSHIHLLVKISKIDSLDGCFRLKVASQPTNFLT